MRKHIIAPALCAGVAMLAACGNASRSPDSPAEAATFIGAASETIAPPMTPMVEALTTPQVTDSRVENPFSDIHLAFEPVALGLEDPVGLQSARDGSGRLFVIQKAGSIVIIQDGEVLPEPFLDISEMVLSDCNERGLLGLAFHPDYDDNGTFYISYINLGADTVVTRYSVSPDDPNRADPESADGILWQSQPASNHNGGNLAFGPDGYLYISMGDGGKADDHFGNGQNKESWLSTLLRVDVDRAHPYAIPPDNPFVDDPEALPEIWAYGLRNPWRFSFDRETGDLYVADVGQNRYEEINVQPAESAGGENYGWPITEGAHCFGELPACGTGGLTLPAVEYSHAHGCAVIGGYVYRGDEQAALEGMYLYGDWCAGAVRGLMRSADGMWLNGQLADTDFLITSFGEDEDGELYVLDQKGGVYHISVEAE